MTKRKHHYSKTHGSGNTAGRKQGNIANSHAAFSFRAVVTVAHHAVSVYTEHFDEGQRA